MSWLVFALVFVVVLPVAESFRERTPSRRRRFLTSALDQTQLVIDTETWASLDRYAARRAQWGAGGRGLGMAIGIAVSLWLMMRGATDALALLPVATSLVGYAIGAALSSQHRSTLSSAEERVSALQPQGFREYLRRRVLATEVGCGILGLLAAGVGVLVLTSDPLKFPGLAPLLPLGLMVLGVTVAALLLQRRLLQLPTHAVGQAQLVEHDVKLALSLRDLAWVVTFTTVLSAYTILTSIGAPIVISLGLIAAFSLLVGRPFDRKLRLEQTPVASRLVGRSRQA